MHRSKSGHPLSANGSFSSEVIRALDISGHTFYATRRALRSLSCSLMDPGGRGAARHGPAADGMDLADEPCAAAATQENDFPMMKVRQLRAMTDADDGRVSELMRQQLHHSILAL